jgi:hypothetical protein
MSYSVYLGDAASTVIEEWRKKHGDDELWRYFENAFVERSEQPKHLRQ